MAAQDRTLRMMSWERTKGEMNAILCTYPEGSKLQEELEKAFTEFVSAIDDCGIIDEPIKK